MFGGLVTPPYRNRTPVRVSLASSRRRRNRTLVCVPFHEIERLFASHHVRPSSSYCTKNRRFSCVRVSPAFSGQIRASFPFGPCVTVHVRACFGLPCLDVVVITERLFAVVKVRALPVAWRRCVFAQSARRFRAAFAAPVRS